MRTFFKEMAHPIVLFFLMLPAIGFSAEIPQSIVDKINKHQQVDVIVEYDESAVNIPTVSLRASANKKKKNIAARASAYTSLKKKVELAIPNNKTKDIKTYSHLPLAVKRFTSVETLEQWAQLSGVKALYEDVEVFLNLSQSLPLINQPTVSSATQAGSGTTVAVIDNGIDFTSSTFGSCISPGSPSSCKVVASNNFALVPNTSNVTHGTNVSATVLGVAPEAKVAMLNVFGTDGRAFGSDIISAINWAIANQQTYNIVAINMSLGGMIKETTPCAFNWSSTAINNATNAGITVVAASGNDLYTDGMASPACVPNAISVGAVYDANYGGIQWSSCTDSTTAEDQVTCFSNSADFLDLLAPGALITAAGITQGGTSQASPHVAGAIAVLSSLYPNESLAEIKARLIDTGTPVTDARNNITKPRINLLEAARPSNDNLANAINISGSSGTTTGTSILASKEPQEPNHAGNPGGSSVWWKWVAQESGQVNITTNGSPFDTLLSIYQGNSINGLNLITDNDNEADLETSSVLFQSQAGEAYLIAIDGKNGLSGNINLSWTLNSNASANLSAALNGPTTALINQPQNYVMTVNNKGPQTATNIIATLNVPTDATINNIPSTCSITANQVNCAINELTINQSVSFDITLTWIYADIDNILSATVSSDVNDPSNHPFSLSVAVSGSDAGEVPTLPQWAMIILSLLLITINFSVRNNNR